MNTKNFKIGSIPAVAYTEGGSEKCFLFIHGKLGCKEEGEAFADIVCKKGFDVVAIDLPEHGQRKHEKNRFNPWSVIPELGQVLAYMKQEYKTISLRANSIGAWFAMQSFKDIKFEKCLFVSPVLDMKKLITDMMQWAQVTPEMLKERKEIHTDFGEDLSWRYFEFASNNPIDKWDSDTAVLYAGKDNLTDRQTVEAFVSKFSARLTVMDDGEHWFHTPEQLRVLNAWTEAETAML